MTLEQLEQQAKELNDKIEAFKRQLEKPKEKAYTWEECFKEEGHFLSHHSKIEWMASMKANSIRHNVATTEKVIQSNLAACQLSHIIEAINKDFDGDGDFCVHFNGSGMYLDYSQKYIWALPMLNSIPAYECLVKHHTTLLKQYFGVEEK